MHYMLHILHITLHVLHILHISHTYVYILICVNNYHLDTTTS